MKKVSLFLYPLLLAGVVFFLIMFFSQKKSSGKGSLQVTSGVVVSRVFLNDRLIGVTPLCRCEPTTMFNEGDYIVKLIPEGNFTPFEQKITINKGTLAVVDATFGTPNAGSVVTLSSLPNKKDLQLLVISFPDKANVFLDNNSEGVTPFLIKNLTVSDHELKIVKEGYKEKKLKISTHAGYKLQAVVFLAVMPASTSVLEEAVSTPSGTLSLPKVTIQSSVGYANVREGGSLSSAIIGKVYSDESYELISEKDGWFEIKLANEKTGWVNSSYAIRE